MPLGEELGWGYPRRVRKLTAAGPSGSAKASPYCENSSVLLSRDSVELEWSAGGPERQGGRARPDHPWGVPRSLQEEPWGAPSVPWPRWWTWRGPVT